MKQIVQNYRTGELWLEDVPTPICRAGGVLVRNEYSVVSTGTERMKVDQARMNLLEKARARPDQVKQVLQTVGQVGLKETFNKVQERLNALTPLGYSSVGKIEQVGFGIDHLNQGDRVVCAGEGIACHAEFVFVPKMLCAKVPPEVPVKEAAFATIGAIAMNGVRQAKVGLGDVVVVIGLGLVGLLGVQILRAAGCRVIGVDIAEDKLDLAKACGAEAALHRNNPNLLTIIKSLSSGRGCDAVYIAASAKTSDPLDLAGEVIRDRGTVTIVGMIPINADWRTYYAKELSVVLSRSYGPGRYDRNFEDKGIDYPVGYVPWTEHRNLEEFVRLVGEGVVTPTKFGAKEFKFEDAATAYREIHETPGKHAAGIIFKYSDSADVDRKILLKPAAINGEHKETISIGMIGAGNFATGTLIPALKKINNIKLTAICSAGGLTAKSTANRHDFDYATSNMDEIFSDDSINAVVIATRHNTHAKFAKAALEAGKHVFVEKPLALNEEELQDLVEAANSSSRILMPGYNRQFSPLAKAVRNHFTPEGGALEVVCRVNAGAIGADSWYQDPEEGGWRIVSEGCHWVDLISFILRSHPVAVSATAIAGKEPGAQNDNCIANLSFQNGSIATLIYVANGDSHYEKERIEVFGQGKVALIDNWKMARLHAGGKVNKIFPKGSGKGHSAEMAAFTSAIRNGIDSPITLTSAMATTLATFRIVDSILKDGEKVSMRESDHT